MPPMLLMIKPASGLCDLRCRYCFYADEMRNREKASYGIMTRETMDLVLQKTLKHADGEVTLAFQGGEPTMAGLDFFQDMLRSVKKWNLKHLPVHYALQTNGIALDEAWADMLAENHFLVGLSLDGIEPIHDANRVDPQGRGTFRTVLQRAELLKARGVDFNILTVVTRQTAGSIGKIYRFFQERGLPWQQYIPCLDPLGEVRGSQPYSLTPAKYSHFLKVLFDNWYRDTMAGRFVYDRYFDDLVGILLGTAPVSCAMLGHCAVQYVVEADGSVYPCDFYVLDAYRLGDLKTDSYADIERRRQEIGFLRQSSVIHSKCRACQWYLLCRGGCRRDREQPDGSLGLNYYCEAYSDFFSYAYPRLEEVARLTRQGRRRVEP